MALGPRLGWSQRLDGSWQPARIKSMMGWLKEEAMAVGLKKTVVGFDGIEGWLLGMDLDRRINGR